MIQLDLMAGGPGQQVGVQPDREERPSATRERPLRVGSGKGLATRALPLSAPARLSASTATDDRVGEHTHRALSDPSGVDQTYPPMSAFIN